MALILIGGTVIVGTVMWKRINVTHNADMLNPSECAGGDIDLKGRGMITESHTEDQLLRLTLEKKPGHDEIITIDTCTGKIVGTLKVETDPGMAEIE